MARDSKLWEQAYESYDKRFPKSKHNKKVKTKRNPVHKPLAKEPMMLLEDYRNILQQVKELTRKRQALRKQLIELGIDPVNYTRSDYYQRPILLYALELENGFWYIGMSRNVDRRFKRHTSKKGASMWTREHKPIRIAEVRETGLTSDSEVGKLEDEMTLEYVKQYGIDKVRGGGYCQRKPQWPKEALEPNLSWIR